MMDGESNESYVRMENLVHPLSSEGMTCGEEEVKHSTLRWFGHFEMN